MSNQNDSWLVYAKTMANYNQQMNTRLYDVCTMLPDARLKEDRGAFFKSIHGTLNHILLADKVWLGRFTNDPFAVSSLAQELHADFVGLRQEREQQDQRIVDWVADLRADIFGEDLTYGPVTSPTPKTLPMWLAVTHFFNHQTHHRGQVTTLLSQMGIDPGVTDLPFV
ncbi:MAG: DinB family protein [Pseudohongiella sp.]|uniref:DinB family protein n=1 Tax=Pseudohongiella sp. TaxID=1979412 RepID=UPI0034A01C92